MMQSLTARFHCAYGFATHRLAYMLDSLVRVSRRAAWETCATHRLGASGSARAQTVGDQ